MRNDEPSSRRPRKKKQAAQTQGAEIIELKSRRRAPQAIAPLDSDFGLALCLMPRPRRRLPEA
jgi:hypothetical protein